MFKILNLHKISSFLFYSIIDWKLLGSGRGLIVRHNWVGLKWGPWEYRGMPTRQKMDSFASWNKKVNKSYLGYIMARPGSNHHRVQGIVSPAQEVSDLGHSKFVPTRVVWVGFWDEVPVFPVSGVLRAQSGKGFFKACHFWREPLGLATNSVFLFDFPTHLG